MSMATWRTGGRAHVIKGIAGAGETAYFEGVRSPWCDLMTATRSMPIPPAVLIKRYAGRRLYHTGMGIYLTLDDLARMVEDDRDFVVREAETGETITAAILQQIIRKRALHG